MKGHRIRRALTTMLCALAVFVTMAQNREVTGVITDDTGAPLQNATVAVKGANLNTTTDVRGVFRLSVPASAQALTVSYVGLQTQEIAITGKNSITVKMTQAENKLNEVVVVGYGTARRANLTNAQTTVSARQIERTVNTTVEQALQGRAAGVYITQNSGQPGGGISVNIRGVSTIGGNTEPLYVIDGVQIQGGGTTNSSNPLASLNPSDIEDIQVLQGPSATAIYGSRATNGVLLITTKRGKSGEARLNYNFQYNIQTPPTDLPVMNLRQYAQARKEFHALAGGTTPQEFLDPSILGTGTNWQDELFNNAAMQKHQLSISGGNNNTTYYMSGEYLKQEGVAIGSGFDRYGFRINLDNKPRTWITLGANLSFSQTNEKLTTSSENVIADALQLTPQVPVKNLNGDWGGGDEVNGATQFAPVNPVAIANLRTNTNRRRQFWGGLNLGLNLAKGLTFRTSLNTDIAYGNSLYFNPAYRIGWAINNSATLNENVNMSTYWNWNQLLEYTRQIGKHNFTAMASHESQESMWKNISAGRAGFLTNDVFDLNASGTQGTVGGGSGPWAQESYLGRINYNYDNRYIITGTYRADGSARFGPEKRWGAFPSISAAWRVAQEKFFNIPAISELKLRVETGLTGNQGGATGIYSPLSSGISDLGNGFLPNAYGNPALAWEETRTDNIGLNLGLLKNRISLEFDYYIKNTDNLIMPNPLPFYMGTQGQGSVGNPVVNIGAMQTKGWGFAINSTNINNKNFKWETNLNLSHFKSVVKRFYSDAAVIDRTSSWYDNWSQTWVQRSAVGLEPWLFRGYVAEGLFQSVDEINKSAVRVDNNGNRIPTDPTGVWVGDVKYRDQNGDGKIDFNDETYIGNPWPKLFGGLTNSFSYKGFELSVLVTGTFGNDIYNMLNMVNNKATRFYTSRNLMIDAMNYARLAEKDGVVGIENAGTNVPRLTGSQIPNDNNYNVISTRWVEDGSFVRIKNVSLGYNVPATYLARQKLVSGIRGTLGIQNLYTFTKYSGYDPEVGASVGGNVNGGNQAIGLDYGRYPLTPIYSFTLGVNF
ncbi:SusC/RagA family TonB-linked outer membrane protein [Paracnuella aquatica]|uniref:SusC/RagA family TonB-linked outer membrane protein n=1 Tax=Paracnuella aquatica TaxID=2268757 RepID=UPI000DEFCF5D|nr:TonB-dependent receptor [Paracnuella aquatica]RPD43995.1 TonB-dependent receptor [Paracnuella aquatica]